MSIYAGNFLFEQPEKVAPQRRGPRPLTVEAYHYFYGVISMFLRVKDTTELSPLQEQGRRRSPRACLL